MDGRRQEPLGDKKEDWNELLLRYMRWYERHIKLFPDPKDNARLAFRQTCTASANNVAVDETEGQRQWTNV